jgi:DNA invertase Pin-like site-specific DNA recombinase
MADQLILMRPDEVKNYFAELKRDLIEEIRNSIKPQSVEKSLSAKEIAAHLEISVRTLWRRFKEGRYPHELIHRDAGQPVFYRSEFDKYKKGN